MEKSSATEKGDSDEKVDVELKENEGPEGNVPRQIRIIPVARTCLSIDASGKEKEIKVDKLKMMKRFDLRARDVRLCNPHLSYPAKIVGTGKAIVLNLEPIRCIITADEIMILSHNNADVKGYVAELRAQLKAARPSHLLELPFEFICIEVALHDIHTSLHAEAKKLQSRLKEAYGQLDSRITTNILGEVHDHKSKLLKVAEKVGKIRDLIEHLMDEESNSMDAMCLTKLKRRSESSFIQSDQSVQHQSDDDDEDKTKLQLLLEKYVELLNLVNIRGTKLMKESDYVTVTLDKVRNRLISVELLLSGTSLVVAILGLVAAVFGTNLKIPLYNDPGALKWIMIVTGACVALISAAFWMYLKKNNLLLFAEDEYARLPSHMVVHG